MRKESEIIKDCLDQCVDWNHDPAYTTENMLAFMHGMRMTLFYAGIDTTEVNKVYHAYRTEGDQHE